MTTPTTARQPIRSERAVPAQLVVWAEGPAEVNEPPTATVNLGLVGWIIGLVPVVLYLGWIAFSTDHSVDWLRVAVHALLIGLAGLVFAEWLALQATMRCPETRCYHQPTRSIADAIPTSEAV
jgi:hypothetical protein